MTRFRRQGWRSVARILPLAVVGVLFAGPPLPEPGRVFAQTDPDRPEESPPPPLAEDHRPPTEPPPDRPPQKHFPATASTRGPTPPQQPTPAATFDRPPQISLPTPPSLERLAGRRISLNQILFRDRRHQLLLSRGDAALLRSNSHSALDHFQALVESSHDAFFWPDDSLVPQGARSTVHTRLRQLPTASRELYEWRHGPQARGLLLEAGSGDNGKLIELLRQFPHTDAGREAMFHELLAGYDSGRLHFASALADRLTADRYHWQQLSEGQREIVGCVQRHMAKVQSTSNVDRVAISPPALTPEWTFNFTTGLSDFAPTSVQPQLRQTIKEAVREWSDEREDRRFPVATANHALAVDNILLVRDFGGIRALDLRSGQTLWAHSCLDSLAAAANDILREEANGGGSPPLHFHARFAGQGAHGQITSDGRSVFYIDDAPHRHNKPSNDDQSNRDQWSETEGKSLPGNRLVALPLYAKGPSPQPKWIRDDIALPTDTSRQGCTFLGPPLPVDDWLFVLMEQAGRIECVALDEADGTIIWRQPIALTEQPIAWDAGRLKTVCTPLRHDSTIICPTEVGIVVGVDILTGVLRWVYDHLDDDQSRGGGRWSASAQRTFGSAELPSRTLLHGGHLYHLPLRSKLLHCINPEDGTLVWSAERHDALAVSAITPEAVVLLGPRDTIGLSPQTGSLLWKTSGPEPAGHGVVAGDNYLLPTVNGRCATISLVDGEVSGSRFGKLLHDMASEPPVDVMSSDSPLQMVSYNPPVEERDAESQLRGGNILVAGEALIVTTPTHVAMIPQAEPLLNELTADRWTTPLSDERDLQVAMLELQLNRRASARATLEPLVDSAAPQPIRAQAIRLFREVLHAELAEVDDPQPILDRLARLPGDSNDSLRLMVCRIQADLSHRDTARLTASIDKFRGMSCEAFISPDGDDSYSVRAIDLVADQLANIANEIPGLLDTYVHTLVAKMTSSGELRQQQRVVEMFSGWPEVAPLRNQVAGSLIAAGKLQQAELLLLENLSTRQPAVAGRANRLLANLYATANLHYEAAASLGQLVETDSRSDIDETTVRQFVRQFSEEHPTTALVLQAGSSSASLSQLVIDEHICDDACESMLRCQSAVARQHHDRIRRKLLTGPGSSVTIIDRGIVSADRSQSRLALINRITGDLQGEFDVPAAYWQLATAGTGCCGQLLPICSREAHGISLLEQRTVWSINPGDDDRSREKVRVGPIGTHFCVLQTPRELSVIHPATGERLWSRSDLPPNVGLLANESTGILCDDNCLTLFDSDQRNYTIYRTRSGRLVRTGCLDVSSDDARRYRHAVDGRLVYVQKSDEQQTLSVWNPQTDEIVLSAAYEGRSFCPIDDGREYAIVSADGSLVIVDVTTGRTKIDTALPAQLTAERNDIAVTRFKDFYVANFPHCENDDDAVAATDEVELPNIRVGGQLLAISPSGRILWQRSVPDAVLLTDAEKAPPFLTLISRIRDPNQRQSATLRVEILDPRSGSTVAQRDDLCRTRLVHSEYRPDRDMFTLVGLDARFDFSYGPTRSDLLIHAEVDNPDLLVR